MLFPKTLIGRVVLRFFLLAVIPTVVLATDEDPQIQHLLQQGRVAEAIELAEQDGLSPAERRFLEGRILKLNGELKAAIHAFEDVLTSDPSHLNAKRELAHTLYLDRQFSKSARHFRALLARDRNPVMRNSYRSALRSIKAIRPVSFTGYFALLPSTNIDNETEEKFLETVLGETRIDSGGDVKSGIGVEAGLSATFRHHLGPKDMVALTLAAGGVRYDAKSLGSNYKSSVLSYSHVFVHGDTYSQLTLKGFAADHAHEDRSDYVSQGIGVDYTIQTRDGGNVGFAASHLKTRYDDSPLQDGHRNFLKLFWHFPVSERLMLGTQVIFEASRPEQLHDQYDGRFWGLDLATRSETGVFWRIGVQAGRRGFAHPFPLVGDPREDKVQSAYFEVSHPELNFRGLVPRLSCSHTHNQSNISLYSFETNRCNLTMSYDF